MKLASWNVNSLRVRLPHLLQWLQTNPVDVLGIQETKLTDDKFPSDEIDAAGYHANFSGQPTYNGVALLTRKDTVGEATNVVIGNPQFEDEQKRLITGSVNGLRVTCAYIPNGQEVDSPKYEYKLAWIDSLLAWLADGAGDPSAHTVLMGDFNIAPEDRDVHNPPAWEGKLHCSAPERERFVRMVDSGLIDSFRHFDQADKAFSWWDYRRQGFRRNAGLRIDFIMVAAALESAITSATIDREPRTWEKPSDHAPVVTELDPAKFP